MTGKPVVRDVVLRAIMSGSDLGVFSGIGSFKDHHLRVLVTMPRTPLSVIKMVAQEPGTNPAAAIDYCSSAAIARVLIKICRDVSVFSFYNQPTFQAGTKLHDFRKGADRFRRREVVYEVLSERILYGGDVLPAHVSKWFSLYGSIIHDTYMEAHGSAHMLSCYDICEKQAFAATEKVVSPIPYEFMVAYHRYTKYLPVTMFFRAVFLKRTSAQKRINLMAEEGYTAEQIQLFLRERELKEKVDFEASVERKRKKRRFARATKSKPVKELFELTQMIFGLGCCERDILSFL